MSNITMLYYFIFYLFLCDEILLYVDLVPDLVTYKDLWRNLFMYMVQNNTRLIINKIRFTIKMLF